MPTSSMTAARAGAKDGRILFPSAPDRARQPLECKVDRGVALGKAEADHGGDGIVLVEGGHRNRREPMLGDESLAERLIRLVQSERGKIDIEEICSLRGDHGKAD